VAGAVPQGFLATGFPPWGASGAYIHATQALTSTLHTIHVPPTRPLHALPPMSGSPQAETGTSDHRQGRRRRHRRRHDGAVAYLAQPPAAFPRCRDLPDSSLADRAGQAPSRCRRREGRGLSAGPGPFMLGLLATPLPPSPSPPLPLPPPNLPNFTPSHPPPSSQNLHTHLQKHHTPDTPSHTHTRSHTPPYPASRREAQATMPGLGSLHPI
jgi:hypothetical protein